MDRRMLHFEEDVEMLYDSGHRDWTLAELEALFAKFPDEVRAQAVFRVKAPYDASAYVELHYDRLETEAEASDRVQEEERRARAAAAARERRAVETAAQEYQMFQMLKAKYEPETK